MSETFFSPAFNAVSLDNRVGERTTADIDFILGRVRLSPGAKVADLGCGIGRHSIELARRGLAVDGYDITEEYLAIARASAPDESFEGTLAFIRHDLRTGVPNKPYDLVVCLHTTFGYFSDAENADLLRSVRSALVPGGAFVLEMTNRDPVVANSPEVKVETIGELTVIKENNFDVMSSRRELNWIYLSGDRVIERSRLSHRLYSPHELVALLNDAAFKIVSLTAGMSEDRVASGSRKLLVIARKGHSA